MNIIWPTSQKGPPSLYQRLKGFYSTVATGAAWRCPLLSTSFHIFVYGKSKREPLEFALRIGVRRTIIDNEQILSVRFRWSFNNQQNWNRLFDVSTLRCNDTNDISQISLGWYKLNFIVGRESKQLNVAPRRIRRSRDDAVAHRSNDLRFESRDSSRAILIRSIYPRSRRIYLTRISPSFLGGPCFASSR